MFKKLLFLCLLLPLAGLFFQPQVQASHLRGGEITMTQISGFQYLLGAAFYRDTLGVQMGASNFVITEVGGNGWTVTVNVPVPTPINLGNGVERYNFIDTVTVPNAGEYTIEASNCCRNAAILNMTNPASESMQLYSTLTVPASGFNSTPVFLNDPVTLAQVNTPWNYNPIPFDPDGDSLYYSLVIPMSTTAPVVGYTLPVGSAPFVLDQLTGGISWTPNALGAFASAVLVEEFRNGVKIGQIVRDMQIIVLPAGQNANRAQFTNTNSWPQNPNGNFQFNLPVGSSFNLTITANDPDLDPLTMSTAGEPMILANNPAAFSSTYDPSSGTVSGTFTWTPDNTQLRNDPYLIAVRTTEMVGGIQLSEDLSILLQTTNATGLFSPVSPSNEVHLYPNPAQNVLNLSFELQTATQVKLTMVDLQGREVAVLGDQEFPRGTNFIRHEGLNLRNGLYFVKIEGLGNQSIVKKVVIKQ